MKPCSECGTAIGRGRDLCPDCRPSNVSETPDYDPRYSRAQTVEGAKARYVSDELPGYGEADLERDVERVLDEGDYPDRTDRDRARESLLSGGERVSKGRSRERPTFEGQKAYK